MAILEEHLPQEERLATKVALIKSLAETTYEKVQLTLNLIWRKNCEPPPSPDPNLAQPSNPPIIDYVDNSIRILEKMDVALDRIIELL
jgi:hypothetical protein